MLALFRRFLFIRDTLASSFFDKHGIYQAKLPCALREHCIFLLDNFAIHVGQYQRSFYQMNELVALKCVIASQMDKMPCLMAIELIQPHAFSCWVSLLLNYSKAAGNGRSKPPHRIQLSCIICISCNEGRSRSWKMLNLHICGVHSDKNKLRTVKESSISGESPWEREIGLQSAWRS